MYRAAPDYVFNRFEPGEAQFQPRDWLGRPYLISFFASWCGPCRQEYPVLLDLHRQTQLTVVGVAYRDRVLDTQHLLQVMGNPFQLLLSDFSGDGAIAWGLEGVPESFIIAADGQVVWHHIGPLTATVVETQILPLINDMPEVPR